MTYTTPPTPQLKEIEVSVTVTYKMRLKTYTVGATPLTIMQQEKVLAEIDEYRWVQDSMPAHPDVVMTFIREVV